MYTGNVNVFSAVAFIKKHHKLKILWKTPCDITKEGCFLKKMARFEFVQIESTNFDIYGDVSKNSQAQILLKLV